METDIRVLGELAERTERGLEGLRRLGALGKEIREKLEQLRKLEWETYLLVGKNLSEGRKAVGEPTWKAWSAKELEIPAAGAARSMRLHEVSRTHGPLVEALKAHPVSEAFRVARLPEEKLRVLEAPDGPTHGVRGLSSMKRSEIQKVVRVLEDKKPLSRAERMARGLDRFSRMLESTDPGRIADGERGVLAEALERAVLAVRRFLERAGWPVPSSLGDGIPWASAADAPPAGDSEGSSRAA